MVRPLMPMTALWEPGNDGAHLSSRDTRSLVPLLDDDAEVVIVSRLRACRRPEGADGCGTALDAAAPLPELPRPH